MDRFCIACSSCSQCAHAGGQLPAAGPVLAASWPRHVLFRPRSCSQWLPMPLGTVTRLRGVPPSSYIWLHNPEHMPVSLPLSLSFSTTLPALVAGGLPCRHLISSAPLPASWPFEEGHFRGCPPPHPPRLRSPHSHTCLPELKIPRSLTSVPALRAVDSQDYTSYLFSCLFLGIIRYPCFLLFSLLFFYQAL